MGYTRKKFKRGRRRMRNSFSKKNNSRKRGGCPCKKKRTQNKMTGGNCTTETQDLNGPIYDYTTSLTPYRN